MTICVEPYRYLGNQLREGIFLMGELINPNDPTQMCLATRDGYNGQLVNLVDQVGTFLKVGTDTTTPTRTGSDPDRSYCY